VRQSRGRGGERRHLRIGLLALARHKDGLHAGADLDLLDAGPRQGGRHAGRWRYRQLRWRRRCRPWRMPAIGECRIHRHWRLRQRPECPGHGWRPLASFRPADHGGLDDGGQADRGWQGLPVRRVRRRHPDHLHRGGDLVRRLWTCRVRRPLARVPGAHCLRARRELWRVRPPLGGGDRPALPADSLQSTQRPGLPGPPSRLRPRVRRRKRWLTVLGGCALRDGRLGSGQLARPLASQRADQHLWPLLQVVRPADAGSALGPLRRQPARRDRRTERLDADQHRELRDCRLGAARPRNGLRLLLYCVDQASHVVHVRLPGLALVRNNINIFIYIIYDYIFRLNLNIYVYPLPSSVCSYTSFNDYIFRLNIDVYTILSPWSVYCRGGQPTSELPGLVLVRNINTCVYIIE